MNQSVVELWQQFKQEKHVTHDCYEAWSFGNSPAMADELLSLVLSGEKTGTSSLYSLYELENEKIPEAGDYSVILDGQNQAKAIICSKVIDVLPYNQIAEVHGYLEGEGDRDLAYWRSVHQPYFEAELAKYDKQFREDMSVVYELFEVVYRA
ncbi:ASCH domain-containing protein [Enterococcus rivorum]|uniref:RNA-binding protein n=1 Tax=Enterococcus rivorum TaxID=762845 RepID=A0A1E5KZI5_9ENTE|nr:ASCH domain-containing protein [Enterococcus rivorum]MBP2099394.1 uncharacterized protein YhfF [Enterococcus rivorum]OEH83258.1 RNA-binding protein [Enterococcus rivorum]